MTSPLGTTRSLAVAVAAALALAAGTGTAHAQTPTPTEARPAEQPLSAAARAAYVGEYEVKDMDAPMTVRVYVEDDKLMARPGDDEPSRLLFQGNHSFKPEMAPEALLVFTVVDGKATRFVYTTPDGGGAEGVRKK
jgi:hypothetical protein